MDFTAYLILGALILAFGLALLVDSWLRSQKAERRAALLVRQLLTPAELNQLEACGYLEVPSRITAERVYRIPASPGLVTVVDSGSPAMRLCLQPSRSLPSQEHVLLHKLLLEGAEDEYWQRAYRMSSGWSRWPDATQVELWTGPPPGVLNRR